MKQYPVYFFFFAMLLSGKLYAAETRSFVFYDSLTYDLYTRQEWKPLTVAGREALKDGYDYYYLRVRVGIAYFQLKNFRQSIPHFRKALFFNSADPISSGYLYDALIESGQGAEATVFASRNRNMIPAAKNKKNPLEFIYTEGGYAPDAVKGHQSLELMGNDSIGGEEDTYASQSYIHAGAGFRILPSLSCYFGFSNLGINKEKHFAGSSHNIRFDSVSNTDFGKEYIYSFPFKIYDTLIPFKVNQNEFYFSASWIPKHGVTITPAFHFISGRTQLFKAAVQFFPRTDTAYFTAFDSAWYFLNNLASRYVISRKNVSFSNYVFSLAASLEWRNFSFGINGSYASLNSSGNQVQAGIRTTWFPLGNVNLYATTSFTGFSDAGDKRLVYDQLVGGKVAPRLWLEGLITLGNLELYNEKNAFIAYNHSDRIKFRTGANLTFTLGRHLGLSLMYRFYAKEYDYLYYSNPEVAGPPVTVTATTKYNNQSLTGGIKWKL